MNRFEPNGLTWKVRAKRKGLMSVMDPYDYKGRKSKYTDTIHKIVLNKYFNPSYGDKVLDFGCGTGRLVKILSKNTDYTGIEITKEMINVAKRKYPNKRFIIYNKKLPFKNNFFDYIVSVWVLQHISNKNDFKKIIKGLKRCLKTGGKLLMIEQVSVKKTEKDWIKSIESKNIKYVVGFPIRKSISIIGILIKKGMIPKFLYKQIAHIDILLKRGTTVPKTGYLDYFFIFKKVK
ncbi:MAG: class I SAM-dependent methyltransferase [Candidatus Aenigmarchaeota archaeon]|nr:class I SAM-dependent methyltransferase [Candidatus Aenigmarchaeota archaeon]